MERRALSSAVLSTFLFGTTSKHLDSSVYRVTGAEAIEAPWVLSGPWLVKLL